METKKVMLFALILCAIQLAAQPIVENRKGNIRVQGNLAAGYLFKQKTTNGYIAGDADVFIDNRVSVTGEIWYGFKLHRNKTGLLNNHAVFGGLNYHFLKQGRWDPYVGLSPGVGVVKTGFINKDGKDATDFAVAPVLSAVVGCNFYVGSIFHFFVKMRPVIGQAFSGNPNPVALHEMKISAGLGWNLRLWKAKS
jgi:hypothetical protein